MYSSDTVAHNHVNSHVLRRIAYVTCQTSHTYNTLPVLFSNLLPSSRVVGHISSLLATLLHVKGIKGIIVFMAKKIYVPHLSTVGVEVSKVCFSLWYLVLSTLFVLTYHPCIISSLHLHLQFQQLSYYIPHFKRELCKHHVRDSGSTRLRKKYLLNSTSSELTCNFSATNYRYCTIRKCKKKYIMCFNFVLSSNTFGLV